MKIQIAMAFIAFVAVINLRGVKESGVFFAVPTYAFIASILTLPLGDALSERARRKLPPMLHGRIW